MNPAVTVRAHANIALVKYWGKRDAALNLPATGSLSMTLSELTTTTTVRWLDAPGPDRVMLDGRILEGKALAPLGRFLDRVRSLAETDTACEVTTNNDFPTAAGLASSASGYAALALAATRAAGLELTGRDLSLLARQGSGSACRSLHGGFVEWHRGTREDGLDSFAEPVPAPEDFRPTMLVAVVAPGPKPVSSRDAMNRTVATSPFFPAWVEGQEAALAAMRAAISSGDLAAVGAIAEANCLKMHATMLGAEPWISFWRPETLGVMQAVVRWRQDGLPCWFTLDAGPNVKILVDPRHAMTLRGLLGTVPGVVRIIACQPGPAAHLVSGGTDA
jgi:diphosphomevalonate decarboxylase